MTNRRDFLRHQDQPDVFRPREVVLPSGPVLKWRFPAGSVTAMELETMLNF